MPDIEIYLTPSCPYCNSARRLLDRKGVAYRVIDVAAEPLRRAEMEERAAGRHTVPQIFIDGEHIGGSDDLHELDADGELDPKLGRG